MDNILCSNAMATMVQKIHLPRTNKGLVANTLDYWEGRLLSGANIIVKEEIMALDSANAHPLIYCATSL